jgi:uncharacterized membrane-anchored protein
MCGFSPLEFAIVALLVATIAGPRLLSLRRFAQPTRALRVRTGPQRPEAWRVVVAFGAVLLVGLLVLRFGSRLVPLLARIVRGSTW